MPMKRLLLLALATLLLTQVRAQLLLTESLTNRVDTTRRIQGSIAPEVGFRSEKENVFNLKNTANLNILVGRQRALTIINKLEISTYGRQVNVSDGFVHAEFRNLIRPNVEFYPFAQSQWAGSRGLVVRAAVGVQSRFRLVHTEMFDVTAGVGVFYEYERWNYAGAVVPVEPGLPALNAHSGKAQFFAGFRFVITDKWSLVASGYYQGKMNRRFVRPRWAYGVDLRYQIDERFGLWGSYHFFYDAQPPVPIRKGYTMLSAGASISF